MPKDRPGVEKRETMVTETSKSPTLGSERATTRTQGRMISMRSISTRDKRNRQSLPATKRKCKAATWSSGRRKEEKITIRLD